MNRGGAVVALLACITLGLTGCTNLAAKRVPLKKRLECKDDCYHGFRYYLSRPYLVVPARVDVATVERRARVVVVPEADKPMPGCAGVQALLEAVDEHGCLTYYDLHGHPLGPLPPGVVPKALSFEATLALLTSEGVAAGFNDARAKDSAWPIAVGAAVGGAAALVGEVTRPPSAQGPAVGSLLDLTIKDGAQPGAAPALAISKEEAIEALQIVHLPDFEEQMAVKHCTIAAKSKIALSFVDGWQLKSVQGNFDATEVPIKILSTIRGAIGAAGELENKRLEIVGQEADQKKVPDKDRVEFQSIGVHVLIRRTLFIEPGMYRLQKPSEQEECEAHHCGGLLADMGIPVAEEVQVRLLAKSK